MAEFKLNAVDKVEILTLQDNYIEMTAMDNNAIISRALSLKDGEIRTSVLAEHGFSTLVKTTASNRPHTLLFDFGFSENGAAQNAKSLGVDMSEVEAVALSHGHSDHIGGMTQLAALIGRRDIPFVVHPSVFKPHRYIKISDAFNIHFPPFTREMVQETGLCIRETKAPSSLLDDTVLFLGEIPRLTDFEKGLPRAYYQQDGIEMKDDIEDDTALVINLQDKGLIILSGCAHSGIVNTVRYAMAVTGIARIHAVIGGFHLSGPSFEPVINRTTQELQKFQPAYIVPTHCTGRKAIMAMEKEMPEQFILNMSGTKLTFVS